MGFGDDIMALGEITALLRESEGPSTMVIVEGKYYESPVFKHHPLLIPPVKDTALKYSEKGINIISFNWNKLKRYGLFYMEEGFKVKAKQKNIISCKKYGPKIADIYFRGHEIKKARRYLKNNKAKRFIFIQPRVKDDSRKNKQWGIEKYQELINLFESKIKFVTCRPKGEPPSELSNVLEIETEDIREAIAILSQASAFVGNEGAMHHAAGALNIPGAVIFGHFISPESTGYDIHENYFYNDKTKENKYGCGTWGRRCSACEYAMNQISPQLVFDHLKMVLDNGTLQRRIFINPDSNYGYLSANTYIKPMLSERYQRADRNKMKRLLIKKSKSKK